MLPPKGFIGGGPAGVVVGLKEEPEAAGVVEPVGADEAIPTVDTFPKSPFDSPEPERGPVSGKGFWGVCEPPRPPNDGLPKPGPEPPSSPLALLPAVVPFDALFSPAVEGPSPAKLKPLPAGLLASHPPNGLPSDD